eukprot:UN01452
MGSSCCGCDVYKEDGYSPIAGNQTKTNQDPVNKKVDSTNEEKDVDTESTEDWKEYTSMMQLVFYTFAGYQPWAKKTGLYMHQKELQRFLGIVNIDEPVEAVFKLIDSDIVDGRLTMVEWMDYFTNKEINPGVFQIRQHIEQQITWQLLVKALRIIKQMDADHSGKLEYGEFEQFGTFIGLNAEETELLWNTMDTNKSGAIDITELFEWFRLRLYQQRARISSQRQPSITFNQSEMDDLEEIRTAQTTIDPKDAP